MYRAERLDGKGKVEGCLIDNDFNNIPTIYFTDTEYDEGRKVDFFNMVSIKPETLEIYLFGEWRLVSELETKYKLVDVSEYDILIKKAFMFDSGLGEKDMMDDSKPEHL
jgi:hypothetical protein